MKYTDLEAKDKIYGEIMDFAERGLASRLKKKYAPPPPAPAVDDGADEASDVSTPGDDVDLETLSSLIEASGS